MSVEEDSDDMLVDFDRLPPTVRETIIQEAPDIAERGNVPLAMLRDPGDIFEIPQLPLTTVNFRIVGIYFGSVPGQPPDKNATGDVQVVIFDNNPNVKDVIDAVEQKANQGNINGVSGFRYDTRGRGRQILDRVEVDYTQSPKPSRGYPDGTYVLQQHINQDPQRVFQYYIYDVEPRSGQADAVRRKNTDNDFIAFNRQPKNSINDGDYVVWRLLTIRTEPEGVLETPEDDLNFGPRPRLPEGIIRTNSRLGQMVAQRGEQTAGSDTPEDDERESSESEADG